MINSLRIAESGLGSDIQLRVNRDVAQDGNTNMEVYIFRKNNSDLTSQEVTDCQNFIAGAGPKPTEIQIYRWYWHDSDGRQRFADRYAVGAGGERHMDFYDNRVEIGRFRKREVVTSGNATTITVKHNVAEVYGIWERVDVYKLGANYYTGGSVAGKVITPGTALPSANTEVYVEYLAEYDDAIQYYYRVQGYDTDTQVWAGDESISAYATYSYSYIKPDVVRWVVDAMKKLLSARDLRQIPVFLEFPQREQHTFFYVSEEGDQEVDWHWADQIGLANDIGKSADRVHITPVKVEFATPDHKLTHAIKAHIQSGKMLLHQHIIRQHGYYGGYSPKIDIGPDMLLSPEMSGGDKPLYMGSVTIHIPSQTVESRDWPFIDMTDIYQITNAYLNDMTSPAEVQF